MSSWFLLACALAQTADPVTEADVAGAYRAWLVEDPWRSDWKRAMADGGQVVARPFPVPHLGETLVHVGGSYEGGHSFFPGNWAWVDDGVVRFLYDSVETDDAQRRLKGLYWCSAAERVAVKEGAAVASVCRDRLAEVRKAFLTDVDAQRVAALSDWLLRLGLGAPEAERVAPGWTSAAEEVRWWGEARVSEASLRVEGEENPVLGAYSATFRVDLAEPGAKLVRVDLVPERIGWTVLAEELVYIE